MKQLMILMVMGLLCLNLSAQDHTDKFYQKGEFLIGVRPGYSGGTIYNSSGQVLVAASFSNSLRVGYFVKDKWLVGLKSSQQAFIQDNKLQINIPNLAVFTRRYVGKGAWRAFFGAEVGVSRGYQSTPTVAFEETYDPYFQGSYGVSFRPGKGKMSLELSSALFNINTRGVNMSLPRPQLGINFHF